MLCPRKNVGARIAPVVGSRCGLTTVRCGLTVLLSPAGRLQPWRRMPTRGSCFWLSRPWAWFGAVKASRRRPSCRSPSAGSSAGGASGRGSGSGRSWSSSLSLPAGRWRGTYYIFMSLYCCQTPLATSGDIIMVQFKKSDTL